MSQENAGPVSLQISAEVLRPIIEHKIRLAIVEGMGGQEKLIGNIVEELLRRKVDGKGQVPNYSSDAKFTFLEYLCSSIITDYAKSVIQEWLAGQKETIQAALKKELAKKEYHAQFAQAFAALVGKGLESTYQCSGLQINFAQRKNS